VYASRSAFSTSSRHPVFSKGKSRHFGGGIFFASKQQSLHLRVPTMIKTVPFVSLKNANSPYGRTRTVRTQSGRDGRTNLEMLFNEIRRRTHRDLPFYLFLQTRSFVEVMTGRSFHFSFRNCHFEFENPKQFPTSKIVHSRFSICWY